MSDLEEIMGLLKKIERALGLKAEHHHHHRRKKKRTPPRKANGEFRRRNKGR